ncbi:MAG: hypothetical protein IKA99_05535 [Clostridia bacterium]|nr:hypothetical protein [Clostridia bacterium]
MKKLKTLICFAVFAVAMLLSVWAITPLTAYAIDQDYNITIADKDGSTTVGVDITTENYEDVLGDGTVSYDPTTNTLTLNNYVYNGEGLVGDAVPCAITADTPIEGLTILLVGTNSITVSGGGSAGMAFFGGGGLTVKGNGSLVINAGAYGIVLVESSDGINIDGGNIHITTTEAMSAGIMALDFVMTSGDLKITASTVGIGTSKEDGICINGGSVEIGTAVGGYSFIYMDTDLNPVKPDTSNYVGDYNMTAGVNTNGSDASEFNEGYLSSYKYIKIASVHIHDYGTTWKSDENNHWKKCACGEETEKAEHEDGDSDDLCDECGYDMTVEEESESESESETESESTSQESASEVESSSQGGTTSESLSESQPKLEEPKGGLSGGAIAGIVVGSVAVAGVGGFALVWFVIKKKSFADLIAVFKKK